MKNLAVVALLLIAPMVSAAQNQIRERRSTDGETTSGASSSRERLVSSRVANHAEGRKIQPANNSTTEIASDSKATNSQPAWGNTSIIVRPSSAPIPSTQESSVKPPIIESTAVPKKLVQPTLLPANSTVAIVPAIPLTTRTVGTQSVYKVGIGDVLDVRLSNLATRESTLFTVLKNGTFEYPLLGAPISVVGMTPDEIASVLSREIKVINSARVSVSVRDYASHAVIISGLVDNPGRKVLRREAMPLFTLLAEALVRPEATTATITRNGKDSDAFSLKDEHAMATVVQSGDVIRISGSNEDPQSFVYVGGDVSSPGEKTFRNGMTLTQALLAAGGASRSTKTTVKVARRNAEGFLSRNEYALRSIDQGKSQDPLIQPGDRIEVVRGP